MLAHAHLLRDLTAELRYAADATQGMEALEQFVPDLILADLQMPPGDWGGLWFLENIPESLKDVPVVMVSGRGAMRQCIEAQRLGAADYIEKDDLTDQLHARVLAALEKTLAERPLSTYRRLRRLEQTLHSLVMSAVRAVAERRGTDPFIGGVIPRDIALKTYERYLDRGTGRQEDYLDLVDFAKLIDKLWNEDELKPLRNVHRVANREARTAWIGRLNEPRKIVAHPTRGDTISPDQMNAVSTAEGIVERWAGEPART